MGIKSIIIFCLCISFINAIDMDNAIKSMDKEFKSSKENKIDKYKLQRVEQKEESLLDALSKEIWSNIDINTPTKIHPRDLKKIIKTKKISYAKSTQDYTGMMNYMENIINQEFTNYLTWVIIMQSFVIVLFIILYLDLHWKIKNITLNQPVSKTNTSSPQEVPISLSKRREELRKLFL